MKSTMIKFLIKLVLLLIITSTIFTLGYVQLYIPLGKTGVMVSKTGGYYESLISHENFTWCWERLVPTNSKLLIFDLSQIEIEKTIQNELENGKQYATALINTPNFSYTFEIKLYLSINEAGFIGEIKKNNIKTQEELLRYLKKEANNIIENTVDIVVSSYQEIDNKYSLQSFKDKCKNIIENNNSSLFNLTISSIKFNPPDFETYVIAKEAYLEKAKIKKEIIEEKIETLKTLQTTLQRISKDVEDSITKLSNES